MNCNRCGNPVNPNSSFCATCGNQINNTVVPQTVNQPTVVPQTTSTVVPQSNNNNNTIIAIIVVLVIFIGAGVAGVTLLKQTKSSTFNNNDTQNIVLNDTTTTLARTTKSNDGNWKTTQRVDKIDQSSSLMVNGYNVVIPDGYIPSYQDNILTVFDSSKTRYYIINVIDTIVSRIDVEQYKSSLMQQGYPAKNFNRTTIENCDTLQFDMDNNLGHIDAYLVQVAPTKVALFMFLNENDMSYQNNIMKISMGK
jgi:hypothetical protein